MGEPAPSAAVTFLGVSLVLIQHMLSTAIAPPVVAPSLVTIPDQAIGIEFPTSGLKRLQCVQGQTRRSG